LFTTPTATGRAIAALRAYDPLVLAVSVGKPSGYEPVKRIGDLVAADLASAALRKGARGRR
jgi:hypothetical protein